MIDVVKGSLDVCIHYPHLLSPCLRLEEDVFDGIVGTTTGSEAVTGCLEARLPTRFRRILDPCLKAPVNHGRDAQWAQLAVGLGDVHASCRFGTPWLVGHLMIYQRAAFPRSFHYRLVHSCRVLPRFSCVTRRTLTRVFAQERSISFWRERTFAYSPA